MKIEMIKVLEYLKPKVKALGFKKEVLEGIAADIADNLEEVEDDASDEDINAKIKPAVDAVIPSLKLAQRLTNQGIEEFRKKQEKNNEPKPNPKPAPEPEPKQEPKPATEPKTEPEPKPSVNPPKKDDETPAWAKVLIESQNKQMQQQQQLIETLQAEVKGIKEKDVNAQRRAILDDLLKDTGTFGNRMLKNYERMTFEKDEDFNSFVSDLKEDLAQLNQERENEGLKKFGALPEVEPSGNQQTPPKVKPMTEAELEELAATM